MEDKKTSPGRRPSSSPRQKASSSSSPSHSQLERELAAAKRHIAELEKAKDPEETEVAVQGVWQALRETGGLAPSKIEEVIRDIRRRGVRMVEE